jgi:hypothetical protein
MLKLRAARSATTCLFACALAACDLYDGARLPAALDASPKPDSAVLDAQICVTETCNGIDDDCNGVADELVESVEADCAQRVLHGNSVCQSGRCVFLRECHAGYYNCDGKPDNGCESECPCGGCDDAGAEADAG